MLSTDRDEFRSQLTRLCAGFDLPVTKARDDAYWSGLAQMSIAQLARCIDYALGPEYDDEKLPSTNRLWKIHRGFRAHAVIEQPQDTRDHLEYYANRLLERHSGNRRGLGSTGKFMPGHGIVNATPCAELLACRKVVRDLVGWFTEPVREESDDATPAAFIGYFTRAIAAVSPIAPATLAAWDEQLKDPAAQLPFPAWMARPLPRTTDPSRPQLELA